MIQCFIIGRHVIIEKPVLKQTHSNYGVICHILNEKSIA